MPPRHHLIRPLLGYTGLFIVFSMWTPLGWLTRHLMQEYEMGSFEIHYLNWFDLTLYFVVLVATAIAQFGFIILASDRSSEFRD